MSVGIHQQMCKYKKRNQNGGQDDFLLNWNIGWKRHAADLAQIASRFSHALLQEFYEQMMTLIQSRTLDLY